MLNKLTAVWAKLNSSLNFSETLLNIFFRGSEYHFTPSHLDPARWIFKILSKEKRWVTRLHSVIVNTRYKLLNRVYKYIKVNLGQIKINFDFAYCTCVACGFLSRPKLLILWNLRQKFPTIEIFLIDMRLIYIKAVFKNVLFEEGGYKNASDLVIHSFCFL